MYGTLYGFAMQWLHWKLNHVFLVTSWLCKVKWFFIQDPSEIKANLNRSPWRSSWDNLGVTSFILRFFLGEFWILNMRMLYSIVLVRHSNHLNPISSTSILDDKMYWCNLWIKDMKHSNLNIDWRRATFKISMRSR